MEFLTTKISSLFDYDKEKVVVNPNVVWLFILASSSFLLILIVWFGVSLFVQVQNESFFKKAVAARRTPNVKIDQGKLAETIAAYEARRTLQNEKKDARLWVPDPSL